MGAIFSHRFFAQGPSSQTTITIPAGSVAVIRCITVYNVDTTAPRSWWLQHQPSGVFVGGGQEAPDNTNVAAVSRSIDLRFVCTGGEQLTAFTGVNAHLTVSGYLFPS